MKKSIAAIALLGMAGAAQAAPATLTSMLSYSTGGSSPWALGASTATWDLDTATGVAMQTGGNFSAALSAGKSSFMTHTMTGGVLSSGTAAATDWKCLEGTFGANVGAHVCGNHNFGANYSNESTYTPTATGATVTIGGDDVSIGAPQTLANSYSGLSLVNLGGGNWRLTNYISGPGMGESGYAFNFQVVPVPPAVLLFTSALGLLGAARRRSTA